MSSKTFFENSDTKIRNQMRCPSFEYFSDSVSGKSHNGGSSKSTKSSLELESSYDSTKTLESTKTSMIADNEYVSKGHNQMEILKNHLDQAKRRHSGYMTRQ